MADCAIRSAHGEPWGNLARPGCAPPAGHAWPPWRLLVGALDRPETESAQPKSLAAFYRTIAARLGRCASAADRNLANLQVGSDHRCPRRNLDGRGEGFGQRRSGS